MHPASALLLPWEAEFPLKIVWFHWKGAAEGTGEALAVNDPAPIQAKTPGPLAGKPRCGGGTF